MAITFRVDEVTKAEKEPPTRSLREHLGNVMAFGGDGERRVLAAPDVELVHPFLGAVHVAFAEHRPLVLSPDVLWLTILAGVTQHVRLNAESLRDRLVRHPGAEKLEVTIDGSLREKPETIRDAISQLRDALAAHVAQGRARLLTCDFSTTTEVERVASEILLLDTFSPYFRYFINCVCGIPELTLRGEIEDWQRIRERVDVIAELDLAWWTASLAPILDEFVRASGGSPNVAFFRDIYQPVDAYGGDMTVGWAARFYPYLFKNGRYDERNPLLARPLGWRPETVDIHRGEGVRPDRVPCGLGACRVFVNDAAAGATYAVSLRGGLAAIEVDELGKLVPIAAWSMVEDRGTMRSVIEAIRARTDVHHEPPEPRPTPNEFGYVPSTDIELLELSDAFGDLRLFAASVEWRVRPPSARVLIAVPAQRRNDAPATRWIDLPDGSFLADVTHIGADGEWRGCIVRMHDGDLEPTPGTVFDLITGIERQRRGPTEEPHLKNRLLRSEIPIVGTSLTELLERALACDGKLDLAPIGFLSDD